MRKTSFCSLLLANLVLVAFKPASAHDHDDGDDHRLRHVFVIVLENEGYDTTFGPNSKAPYLSQTLTEQGVLLPQYYGTGHASLDNYIAMISGISPHSRRVQASDLTH
jgi:hypothetical protein